MQALNYLCHIRHYCLIQSVSSPKKKFLYSLIVALSWANFTLHTVHPVWCEQGDGSTVVFHVWCKHWAWLSCGTSCLMQALSLALLWYIMSDASIELGSPVVHHVWCKHWAWHYCITSCLMQALSLALLWYFMSDASIELGSTVVLHVWCKHRAWL
jgi:hypothetical protein